MTHELKFGLAGALCFHLLLFVHGPAAGERPRYEVTVAPSSLEVSLVKHLPPPPAPAEELLPKDSFAGKTLAREDPGEIRENFLRGAFQEAKPHVEVNEPPRYPRMARQRGYEGRVILSLQISAEGRVTGIEILQSSGHSILDESARRAIALWRFHPAQRFGVPCPGRVKIPVLFKLDT